MGLAPEVGFEPTTNRLTADRSTTELLRNFDLRRWEEITYTRKIQLVFSSHAADGKKDHQ